MPLKNESLPHSSKSYYPLFVYEYIVKLSVNFIWVRDGQWIFFLVGKQNCYRVKNLLDVRHFLFGMLCEENLVFLSLSIHVSSND